jgi:23S rRNA (uridine2552-2'-O)-methyltransferase
MGRRFLAERKSDLYYRAAQKEGLRSRAAFKLDHLAERYPILRPGSRVLEFGAAPGGWTIIAQRWIGPRGTIVAVDPRAMEPIPGVTQIRLRIESPLLRERLAKAPPFQTVLSDMSPRISGAYSTDHARSVDLVRAAGAVAIDVLAPGGSFVAKVFDGDLLPDAEVALRPHFLRWHRTKPPASREASSEMYVIGLGFRGRSASERTTPSGGDDSTHDEGPAPPGTRYIDRRTDPDSLL